MKSGEKASKKKKKKKIIISIERQQRQHQEENRHLSRHRNDEDEARTRTLALAYIHCTRTSSRAQAHALHLRILYTPHGVHRRDLCAAAAISTTDKTRCRQWRKMALYSGKTGRITHCAKKKHRRQQITRRTARGMAISDETVRRALK